MAKPRAATLIVENRRHSIIAALFPIECKRLPTPKEKDRDEREYVITEPGSTDGNHRFKFGHHGSTHKFAAMMGYVQEQTSSHWLGKVNGWIRDLSQKSNSSWSDSDALQSLTDDSVAGVFTFNSRHSRTGGLEDCELRHLWIRMN